MGGFYKVLTINYNTLFFKQDKNPTRIHNWKGGRRKDIISKSQQFCS